MPCTATVGWKMPEAASENRLVALVETPGEADSRAEIVLVGVDQRVRQTGLVSRERTAESDQARRQLGRHLRVRRRCDALRRPG